MMNFNVVENLSDTLAHFSRMWSFLHCIEF